MKNKAVRFTALILIFSFVFALSACKKDDAKTTTVETTTRAETTVPESTTADQTAKPLSVEMIKVALASAGASKWDENISSLSARQKQTITTYFAGVGKSVEFRDGNAYFTEDVIATTLQNETTASNNTTTATEKTTLAAGLTAPVGGSIADIVSFYNQHANATKEYQGKITVQRKMGTKTEITKFLPGLKGILQGVLDRQLKDKDETKTFVNGKNPGDSNDTLEKFLPRSAGQKMSTLKPEGVKTATCVADGNGWKVVITLKKEVMNGIDTIPPHHSSVMDPLEIDNESMDPFTLGDGQVIYGQIKEPNNGGTLSAKVNPNGYLDYLKLDAPLQISGKLGYKGSLNIETVIVGTFWGDLTFTYPS